MIEAPFHQTSTREVGQIPYIYYYSRPNHYPMRHCYLIFSLVILLPLLASAQSQTPNREKYRLPIHRSSQSLIIDGLLDEPAWQAAEVAKAFTRVLPIDTGFASAETEVRMTYDDNFLYMAIICHDTLPGKRPVESLRRDFSFGNNDNFLLFMDTYNDQTNGFSFGLSASGAQWDGIQANGGTVLLDWDCKWYSEVQSYEDRWVGECAIPFRSIRYKEGVKEWGVNFSRLDLKQNEKSSWAPVPRQFPTANLAYTGTLVWDEAPPRLGTRFSLIPYLAGRTSKNVEEGTDTDWGGDVGLDAKVTLSTSMNLDLTVNPDFSQVEVDQQVTNLDRFELFFPERRQFFLENSDLFASLGSESIRPFFSRRIGLNNPVVAGGRLSGKLNEKWRLGLMNMQTASKGDIAASNFSVAALQRQVFSRSNVAVFMVNKQVTADKPDSAYVGEKYNRVVGADFNLASADNRWTGKVFFHKAFYPEAAPESFVASTALAFNTQTFSATWEQAYVGAGYQAETGFVRRNAYHQFAPTIGYKFFPGNSRIANHGPGLEFTAITDPHLNLTDREIELSYVIQWLNRSALEVQLEDGFVKLLDDFDPTQTGGNKLKAGETFTWNELAIIYASDKRRLFNFESNFRYGGFFNGDRLSMGLALGYRVQPYSNLAVVATYNQLVFDDPDFNDTELILVGPRLDLTFTDKLFLTTFLQYNNQIDNTNINVRFQWRFAPVSDLFIVYTDNAYPEGWRTKNRALVAKISYWLN